MYGCYFFKKTTAYEMRFRDCSSDVCSSDLDTLQRQIEQSGRWGRPFDTECRIVLPDGGIRWLSVKGQSTRRPANPTDQVTGVVLDVSERKAEQIDRKSVV